MFDQLLIDQEDLTTHVVGQTYTEPVRDLVIAAHAFCEQTAEEAPVRTNRPAENGEPDRETLAGLLSPVSLTGGWSKTAMVELRGFEPLTPSMRTRCATGLRHSPLGTTR